LPFYVWHKYISNGLGSGEQGGYNGLLIAVSLAATSVSAGDLSD